MVAENQRRRRCDDLVQAPSSIRGSHRLRQAWKVHVAGKHENRVSGADQTVCQTVLLR